MSRVSEGLGLRLLGLSQVAADPCCGEATSRFSASGVAAGVESAQLSKPTVCELAPQDQPQAHSVNRIPRHAAICLAIVPFSALVSRWRSAITSCEHEAIFPSTPS